MKYIEVDSIEDANYWMAGENEKNIKSSFTVGKLYKLELKIQGIINTWGQNIIENEYWVIDDNGRECSPFPIHNGKFVKVVSE